MGKGADFSEWRSVRYCKTDQRSPQGEILYDIQLLKGGVQFGRRTVVSGLLQFELNALRREGYFISRPAQNAR